MEYKQVLKVPRGDTRRVLPDVEPLHGCHFSEYLGLSDGLSQIALSMMYAL